MRVLSTYTFKGGVGKTSTAVSLAALAAREGERVLVWDLDPQGAATFLFRIEERFEGGGKGLVRGRGLLEAVRASDHAGLDVLPADFSFRHLDRLLHERGRGRVAELARALAGEYDLLVIDCPPSFSATIEGVLAASDAVLAPTVPTALSLRTLARFLRHLKERGAPRPRVLPFFCMVDRRKALHRRVCDWSHGEGLGFLRSEIPYSSAVEQMGVRRLPLAEFARGDRAARAYETLWQEVRAALDGRGAPEPRHSELDLLQERTLRREVAMEPHESHGPHGPHEPHEIEFKLLLDGEEALEALARAAERRGARRAEPVSQENHFFDTPGAELRARGIVVRLREAAGRYVLALKGAEQARGDALLHERPEFEAALEADRAREALARGRLPLDLLAEALGGRAAGLLEEARAAAGAAGELGYAGSFRNLRLRLGPLAVAGGTLALELDRTELPGGRVDHELELEVPPTLRGAGARLVRELLAEAGLEGRPAPSKAERFFAALAGRRWD